MAKATSPEVQGSRGQHLPLGSPSCTVGGGRGSQADKGDEDRGPHGCGSLGTVERLGSERQTVCWGEKTARTGRGWIDWRAGWLVGWLTGWLRLPAMGEAETDKTQEGRAAPAGGGRSSGQEREYLVIGDWPLKGDRDALSRPRPWSAGHGLHCRRVACAGGHQGRGRCEGDPTRTTTSLRGGPGAAAWRKRQAREVRKGAKTGTPQSGHYLEVAFLGRELWILWDGILQPGCLGGGGGGFRMGSVLYTVLTLRC